MSKWIAEFELEDGDTMPKHMDLNYMGAKIDFHCRPMWIPCSEKLPKKGEYDGDVAKYYLVQNEYGDMLVARYTHSEYWEQIYQLKPIADEIIAWCELPQPYTESEVEEC